MKNVDYFVEQKLDSKPGDIIIYEDLFEDSDENDVIPFDDTTNFKPTHTAVWIGGDHPLAHSVRHGYRLPGLRATNLQQGRAVVFRASDSQFAKQFCEVFKTWALSKKSLSKSDYESQYPKKHWKKRSEKDLYNFFSNEDAIVGGPATIYAEPRATYDMYDLMRASKKNQLADEGLRRAIKFATRRALTSPEGISKGQRCTPVVIAAMQAVALASIVPPAKSKKTFKVFKDQPPASSAARKLDL